MSALDKLSAREAIIKAHAGWLIETGRNGSGSMKAFAEAYNQGEIKVDDWARRAYPGLTAEALGAWYKRQEADGPGLAPSYGHRKGSGLFDNEPWLRQAVISLSHRQPKMSAADILKALEIGFPGKKLPSKRALQRFLGGC